MQAPSRYGVEALTIPNQSNLREIGVDRTKMRPGDKWEFSHVVRGRSIRKKTIQPIELQIRSVKAKVARLKNRSGSCSEVRLARVLTNEIAPTCVK
jgi:hypothetical protein